MSSQRLTDRELMQQALEALEMWCKGPHDSATRRGANTRSSVAIAALRERLAQPAIPEGYALIGIDALKAWGKYDLVRDACQYPLAQPEQEPVANYCRECLTYNGHHEGCSHYTAPPRREWVGLTREEIDELEQSDFYETVRAIEAKLKEKNGGGV